MNYKAAAEFWLEKDKAAVKMPPDELQKELDSFLKGEKVCTLAVADGDFIRCTPLTYTYREGRFYIFSEGGLKFRALAKNKNVALEVHAEYHGPGSAKSVQVTGVAEVIGADDADFIARADAAGMKGASLQRLGLILVVVTAQKLEYLNSELRKRGYCPRQCMDLSDVSLAWGSANPSDMKEMMPA